MNQPHPESPNGLWARLGYTIEHIRDGRSGAVRRTIRRPDGSIAAHRAGYEAELEIAQRELAERSQAA